MERVVWYVPLITFFFIHELAWWCVKKLDKPPFIIRKILRYSYILRYWARDHAIKD